MEIRWVEVAVGIERIEGESRRSEDQSGSRPSETRLRVVKAQLVNWSNWEILNTVVAVCCNDCPGGEGGLFGHSEGCNTRQSLFLNSPIIRYIRLIDTSASIFWVDCILFHCSVILF